MQASHLRMSRRALRPVVGVSLSLALGLLPCCSRQPNGQPPTPTPEGRGGPTPDAGDPVAAAVSRIVAAAAADPDSAEVDAQVAALVALGEPAIPHLRAALAHPDYRVRLFAVQVLAEAKSEAGVDPLLTLLGDPRYEVRLSAVEALGTLRSPRAATALLAQLEKDDDEQVRYECLTSLGLIGSREAVPRLVEETQSGDPYSRMWAMDALCTMLAPEAPTLLPRLLKDANVYVRRQVIRSCQASARADAPRRTLLDVALSDADFESSFVAREALVKDFRGAPAGGEARTLIENEAVRALASTDSARSLRGALLLGNLGDARALDPLVAALGDKDPLIRHHAAHLLSEIQDRRAVPPLIAALDDPTPLVRATALSSLQRYAKAGDPEATKAAGDFARRAR